MKLNVVVLLVFLMLFVLVLSAAVFGGIWYFGSYATTTTTTSTTTTTTTTTTSITVTSTSTTSTSTSTTTITSFYVCEKAPQETKQVMTRCYGKIAKEWRNYTIECGIVYKLINSNQEPYDDWRAKVYENTCYYTSEKVSISVGSMATCEIPKDVKLSKEAELVIED